MCNKCKQQPQPVVQPVQCCKPVLVDCGCKSKTEFACVTYTGQDLQPIDITRGMSGDRVLEAINDSIDKLQSELNLIDLTSDIEPSYQGVQILDNGIVKGLVGGEGIILTSTPDTIIINAKKQNVVTPTKQIKVVAGEGIRVDFDGNDTYRVSTTFDTQSYIDSKINNLKEELMAYLRFIVGEANTWDSCIQLTDTQGRTVKTIRVGKPVYETATLSVKLINTCSMAFTLPRTQIFADNGVTVTLNELVIPAGRQVSPTVTIEGTWTGAEGTRAINGNVQGVPALVDLNILAAETYATCIKVAENTSVSATGIVLKNSAVNYELPSVTLVNECSIDIIQPEVVIINENGLKVTLPSVTIPANSTKVVNYLVQGTYTGTKTQLTGNTNINGTRLNVTINVTDTAPIANDVVVELENRENRFFDATLLVWTDAEGDNLEAIRFTGDVSKIFVVPTSDANGIANKVAVVAGREYAPTTKFYFEAPDQNERHTYEVTYNVKAGGQWSN